MPKRFDKTFEKMVLSSAGLLRPEEPQFVIRTMKRLWILLIIVFAGAELHASVLDSCIRHATNLSVASLKGPLCLAYAHEWRRRASPRFCLVFKRRNAIGQRPLCLEVSGHKRQSAFLARGHTIPSSNTLKSCICPTTEDACIPKRSFAPCECAGRLYVLQGRSGTLSTRDGVAALSLVTGKRLGTPSYATVQVASNIPMTTKQLKRRERAEVQVAGETEAIKGEAAEEKEGAEKRLQRVKAWRVVLHNDDIHTFEYVEDAITKILPHITRARAYDIALHAHTNRQATIMLTWEEKAREIALALQDEGLTVSIFPNKIFKQDA